MALGLGVGTLWALLALLGRTEQTPDPVTVTAAIGADVCLPCGTRAWGELLGATLGCSLLARADRAEPVFVHRLEGPGPPLEPGWQPPLEPPERFRGRVAFCPAGTGGAGVSLLLRNLSQDDFGIFFCYAARDTGPLFSCRVYLQPGGAGSRCRACPRGPQSTTEVQEAAGLNVAMVIGVVVSVLTVLGIGLVVCARGQGHCWGRRARGSAQEPGAVAGREQAEVPTVSEEVLEIPIPCGHPQLSRPSCDSGAGHGPDCPTRGHRAGVLLHRQHRL